ncbi:hypothetical protein B7435_00650, partial [Mycolicibacterium peregrinum]
ADTDIYLGDDTPLSTSGLVERTSGAAWRKLIASGHHLVAGLDLDGRRAVLIVDLGNAPLGVARLRYFTDEA